MSSNNANSDLPNQTVVALFADRGGADQSITRLLAQGFRPEHIGVLGPDDVRSRKNPAKRGLKGVLVGGLAGAVAGGLLGTFAVGLPDVGGAILAAVVGIGLGGYAGAILGDFFGNDSGGEDEIYFVEEIQAGRVLVSAEVVDREGETRALSVLQESDALEVDSLGSRLLRRQLHHPAGTARQVA